MNQMEEISNYYRNEVKKLTGKDFLIESLSRHCSSGINLIDSLSEKEFKNNYKAKEIKSLLVSVYNNIEELKSL